MNLFSTIPLLSFIFNSILAAFVIGLNPHSQTNRSYALFAGNFAFWAFLNFLEWNFQSPQHLRLFAHLEPIAWLPSTFLVLKFIYALIKRPPDSPYRIIRAAVIIWLVIAVATGCLVEGFKPAYWGTLVIVTKLYFPAVLMTSLLPAFWGFHLLLKTAKTARDPSFRIHLRYLTIGTLAMYMLVISDSVVKTSLLKIDALPSVASFLLLVQSAFVFMAIVRHRFLNIDVRDAAHQLFYNVNEGVILLDLNQGISTMNASAHKFFGTTTFDTATIRCFFGKNYRYDQNVENLEISFLNNGEKKTGLLSQSDLCVQGRFIGKLIIIHDITLQREDERKRVILENQVLQLHASRLEALGKLAGGMAHDFNNILSVITGNATLLRIGLSGKDPALFAQAESIIKTAWDASVMARKVLTFARRDTPEMAIFDLHDTITDVVTMLHHTISKRIKVETALAAKCHLLSGDRIQIQNMLLNIAINAGDAMPEGGLLNFSTRNEELCSDVVKTYNKEAADGTYIIVDIKDNGCGMTDETKKNIFEPFFTTKEVGKGTGLGLATAYGTSLNHKGFITVDSAPGAGTIFHLFFPVGERLRP